MLAQTHHRLELVISDNASSDDTASIARALCERDERVRYLRAPVNRGPTANFNVLFGELRGDYAMVLSDDDWLEQDYLAACLAELRARPGLVLACGVAHYLRGGALVREGARMQLREDSPATRVRSYLRAVDENGLFYGLMPRAVMQRAAPLRNTLGNDWLLAAGILAQGQAATISTTAINRELDGTSADFAKLAGTLGLPRWQARVPHLVMAWHTFVELGWRAKVYADLPARRRLPMALRCSWLLISWRSLAWHLSAPIAVSLEGRPWGRPLARAYHSLTRRLGAGR